MKILSWNIRGSRSSDKRRAIKALIGKESPDLVVLQEVKRESVNRGFIGSIWSSRFKEWILLPAIGKAGGLLVVWDSRRLSVSENLVGDFSISVRVFSEGKSWWFSGVHGPCSGSDRQRFWDELAGLSAICGGGWCIAGDFNVTRFQDERSSPTRARRGMSEFNEFISDSSLDDPPLKNATFTWSSFRVTPTCCRLDRFLLGSGWKSLFPFGEQEALLRRVSDHSAISFSTSPPSWGPAPFRFENRWLEDSSFRELVKSRWSDLHLLHQGWEGHAFMHKLHTLKGHIRVWAAENKRLTEGVKHAS